MREADQGPHDWLSIQGTWAACWWSGHFCEYRKAIKCPSRSSIGPVPYHTQLYHCCEPQTQFFKPSLRETCSSKSLKRIWGQSSQIQCTFSDSRPAVVRPLHLGAHTFGKTPKEILQSSQRQFCFAAEKAPVYSTQRYGRELPDGWFWKRGSITAGLGRCASRNQSSLVVFFNSFCFFLLKGPVKSHKIPSQKKKRIKTYVFGFEKWWG